MYNRFFEYLKQSDPEKVISKTGIRLRRLFNPILRTVAPLMGRQKMIVVKRGELNTDKPIIFSATHGFRDDILFTVRAIRTHAYLLFGNLSQFYNSLEGVAIWINGTVIVDRTDKESRKSVKEKMKYLMSLGGKLIIYPEGTWNKSENQLVLELFRGVYDVAKETGAMVVPVATHREGQYVYVSIGELLDIANYDALEGLTILRDRMATLKWELMERYSNVTRKELLEGRSPAEYWRQYIEGLISEVEFYDREVEDNAHFRSKVQNEYEAVCAHLENLEVKKENAFLWRR